MEAQYTIIEYLHPTVVAPTREIAIKLAKEFMLTHPTKTMYVLKVVAVIDTASNQKITLHGR